MSRNSKSTQLVLDLNLGYVFQCRASNGGGIISGVLKIPESLITNLFKKGDNSSDFASFFRTNGVPIGKTVVILPARLGSVKFFQLPSAEDSEITSMVDFEAGSHLPAGTEWRWSFQQRKNGDSGSIDIALHSIRKQLLANCLENLRSAGMEPAKAYPFSASAQCLANLPGSKFYKDISALLFAGEKEMTLSILENGLLRYTRVFSPDSIQETINEVTLSINDFRASGKKDVEALYIFGEHGYEKELSTLLTDRLDADVLGMGWSEMNLMELRASGTEDEKTISSGIVVAAAASMAQNGSASRLDIMPRPSAIQKKQKRGKFVAWFAAVAVVAIIISIAILAGEKSRGYSASISALDKQIAQLTPEVESLSATQVRLAAYQSAREGISPLDIIKELSMMMPEKGIKITRFFYEKDGRISIAGQADGHTEVMQLIADMNRSRLFTDTHLDFSRRSTEFSLNIVNFEVSAELSDKGEQPQ